MIRELPEHLVNQIAAGEVVERPASVVKELVENALDAGADQITIDVVDGGRTMICVIDNGSGMGREDLAKSITRHATSKLPDDDLLNINFMGFRGEALPSIASVSEMTIDTRETRDKRQETSGWQLNCTTGEIKPSSWESGTRIRVANLFANTPARLKFLRGDRAEMMSVVDTVKRLAMARPDVGFVLNNKWRYPRGESLQQRIESVMGVEVRGRMIEIGGQEIRDKRQEISGSDTCLLSLVSCISLHGFISEPTLRRASGIDQYLFVNGRPVKDKVLVGALRAAYMDVMSAREFPLCALYLELDPRSVDVNVSPAKTEVHFLEPARVRGHIIKTLRAALAMPLASHSVIGSSATSPGPQVFSSDFWKVKEQPREIITPSNSKAECQIPDTNTDRPLGRVIGQFANKYILATTGENLVIVDQHAAHERQVYEILRMRSVVVQPLLTPIIINMKPEQVSAVLEIQAELKNSGLTVDQFGDNAIAIFEKPADWDLDWCELMCEISDEVLAHGVSVKLGEKLHLKLANYACHHSVRAGQKLDVAQMDALLRDIEKTERAGQCNHGRPVYKVWPISELDKMFERL